MKEVPGFICAYHFNESGAAQRLNEAETAEELAFTHGWHWLHLNLADHRVERWLAERHDIPRETVQAFACLASRPTFMSRNHCLIGHICDFRRDFDMDSTELAWLHVLEAPRLLVTGRVKALQSAERIRGEIDRGRRYASPGELLYAFLDNYPETADRLLHRLLDQLELIEDHILDERHRNERKQLMLVRREAAQVHRHMRALRRALSHAERSLPEFPESFTSVTRRLTGLEQDFDAMEVRAKFFHDEIDAKLASETNRQLYILSALTAAFLPPTLVAGLFGMNFSDLPWGEAHGGFWTALGLCLLSSAAVWLYLWRLNRS